MFPYVLMLNFSHLIFLFLLNTSQNFHIYSNHYLNFYYHKCKAQFGNIIILKTTIVNYNKEIISCRIVYQKIKDKKKN